ncbi:amino acid ABC transporter substrate-binding protein [Catellatospora sp. TT07R-123]|nr:amino acid ABC transporter substrate-binding protein [Catellatospora sp. TT07R-123]
MAGGTAIAMLALAACAPVEKPDRAPATPAALASCAPGTLTTLSAGKLTIATDDPAYPPWFADNRPDSGQGFESAIAYAVAEKLGYARDQITWTRVPFNDALTPGPKKFDFDINEFSITADRAQAVDFSTPYYEVTQTVIAVKGSKITSAESLADLKQAKLGAQVDSTSYRAITEIVKPETAPAVFKDNDDAKKQLQNGSVDGIVVDLPTAFYMTSAELDGGVLVGQLPQPAGTPEQFGLVLPKGSALTSCLSQAVDVLRADGVLESIQRQWLGGVAGAPRLG